MWHTHTLVFIFLGEGCIIYTHPSPQKKNTKEMEMASEYCSVASVSLGRIDSMCRCRFLMWGLWVAILPDEYLVPNRKVTWRRCIFPIGNGDFSNCHLSFPGCMCWFGPPPVAPASLGTTRMTMTESVLGWEEISWFLNLTPCHWELGGTAPSNFAGRWVILKTILSLGFQGKHLKTHDEISKVSTTWKFISC